MSEHPLTPPAEAKERLRRQALTRRAALTGVDRAEASLQLADFAADLELQPAAAVAGFWPIRDGGGKTPFRGFLCPVRGLPSRAASADMGGRFNGGETDAVGAGRDT